MKCEQSQLLLEPYLDGELDVVQSLEVADHLRQCAACDQARAQLQELSRLLVRSDLRRTAPAALAERVRETLPSSERPTPMQGSGRRRFTWAAVVAALVMVALAITFRSSFRSGPSAQELLSQEVTSAHVRSLLVNHLVDVASSDRHTVKPWFNGKLDFAAPAVDLTDRGYELVGGRLDVLDMHPVAALAYRRRQHVINVFLWPASDMAAFPVAEEARRGFNLVHWQAGGRNCWIVSDLNSSELRDFAALFHERADQTAGG